MLKMKQQSGFLLIRIIVSKNLKIQKITEKVEKRRGRPKKNDALSINFKIVAKSRYVKSL